MMDSSMEHLLRTPVVSHWQPWTSQMPHRPQPVRLTFGMDLTLDNDTTSSNLLGDKVEVVGDERRYNRPVVCSKNALSQYYCPEIKNISCVNSHRYAKHFADVFAKRSPLSWEVKGPITQVLFNNSPRLITHLRLTNDPAFPVYSTEPEKCKARGRIFLLSTGYRPSM